MKIKEIIERECCNPQIDLKKYKGHIKEKSKEDQFYFCVHCGQIWFSKREMEAAGSMEDILIKVPF